MKAKPWRWQKTTIELKCLGVNEAWHLIDPRGRNRCTVWTNGIWHTWDTQGVGGENDNAINVEVAKEEATMAVIRQGWARLTTA